MGRKERCPQCGSKKITIDENLKKCNVCKNEWTGKARRKTPRRKLRAITSNKEKGRFQIARASSHNAQKKTYSVELKQKKGKLRIGLLQSLAFLKQQVMVDICSICSCLIGVESPAVLFPFLNCFTYILMVTNFHAFPFFQLNSPSITHQPKPAHKKFRKREKKGRILTPSFLMM